MAAADETAEGAEPLAWVEQSRMTGTQLFKSSRGKGHGIGRFPPRFEFGECMARSMASCGKSSGRCHLTGTPY